MSLQDNRPGARIVSGPVMEDVIGGYYDLGAHIIEYVVRDAAGLESYCRFKIKVTGTYSCHCHLSESTLFG